MGIKNKACAKIDWTANDPTGTPAHRFEVWTRELAELEEVLPIVRADPRRLADYPILVGLYGGAIPRWLSRIEHIREQLATGAMRFMAKRAARR